jgi:hypothetical protein
MSGKFALIIGNTEYTDPGLAQLTAPGKDAEDFARVLKNTEIGAFDIVTVLVNEQASSVIEAIDEFFDQKKPDDLLVLYFSGHGIRDEIGSLYLAFKNTIRSRLRSTAVKSDYIKEAMDQSRSKRQVLILDCCNSGAFPQGTKAELGGSMGMTKAFQGYGRFVLTASDATQFAWEGDKVIGETDNSLFTHFLVKGLKGEADSDGDGRITVDELYDYTFHEVSRVTPKQTPTKSSSKQEGEIVLRQSTRMEDIKPAPLPDDLIAATKSSLPFVREGAVRQLDDLLKGKNLGLARSAREALERIAEDDDSKTISRAAFQALESVKQAEAESLAKLETERVAEDERQVHEQAEAQQKAEAERIAKVKLDTERKAKEEAERFALQKQKAEEERLAELEATRFSEEKQLVTAKAKAERKAKEEAERLLAAQKAEEERIAKTKLKAERLDAEKRLVTEKTDVDHKTEESKQLAESKVALDSIRKERLAQIPLATFLITTGLSYLIYLPSIPAIFSLLAGIFMISRRKILSNRFFIYSLLAYLVSISLSFFVYNEVFYILNGLLAILAGGSLSWHIFNPKDSSYAPVPYSSIAFSLLLFIIGLVNFGVVYLPYILNSLLALVSAFLIFKRK